MSNYDYEYSHKRKYYRYGQAELELIDAIQCGLISGVFYLFTQLPEKLKPFFKKRGQKKFEKTIKRLEEKGIISLSGEKIKLTAKGKKLQKLIKIKELTIEKPKQWDNIWRLVSYDIPNSYRLQRDHFRRMLEKLHFRKIHESLWVYPFECKEEIAVIAENLEILPYVIFMVTDHLPNQTKMKKLFNLH